jgi:hypothetical protein
VAGGAVAGAAVGAGWDVEVGASVLEVESGAGMLDGSDEKLKLEEVHAPPTRLMAARTTKSVDALKRRLTDLLLITPGEIARSL